MAQWLWYKLLFVFQHGCYNSSISAFSLLVMLVDLVHYKDNKNKWPSDECFCLYLILATAPTEDPNEVKIFFVKWAQ